MLVDETTGEVTEETVAEVAGKVPAKITAKLLLDYYGIPKKGDEFDYDDIENIIERPYSPGESNDWYRITKVWRNYMRDKHGLLIQIKNPAGSKKFRCLTDPESVGHIEERLKQTGRKIRLTNKEILTINRDNLSDDENHRLNVATRRNYILLQAHKRKIEQEEAARFARYSATTIDGLPKVDPRVPKLPDSTVPHGVTA